MSIYKYKNNWKAEVWIDNRRVTGKAGFATKAEAKDWHDRTVIDYKTDPYQFTKPKSVLFDELLAKYQEIHLPNVSSITASRYQVDIDHRIKPFFQFRPIESITPILVESFRAKVVKELSVKSVNNCVNLLYAIFRKGEEWGLVERNPVRVKALKVAEQKYAWWEDKEDIVRFLEVAKDSPYYVAFRLAVECGLRLGEIVGLSKQDISLERNLLHVHRQWIDKEGAYGRPKGGASGSSPFIPTRN